MTEMSIEFIILYFINTCNDFFRYENCNGVSEPMEASLCSSLCNKGQHLEHICPRKGVCFSIV